jgi:DNA-binding protein H-NS
MLSLTIFKWSKLMVDVRDLTNQELVKLIENCQKQLEINEKTLKRDFIKKISDDARALGLNPSDILKETPKGSTTRIIKPKYKLDNTFWSGRGKCPVIIKAYIDNGGNKEDLLIKDGDSDSDEINVEEIFKEKL